MAIRRVASRRRRRSTLVANPSRRVRRARAAARRNPRKRRAISRTARRNPTRRRVTRKAARRNPIRRRRAARRTVARRNPVRRRRSYAKRRNADLVIAGVPVLDMAIGSLGALVIVNTLKNLGPVQEQLAKIESAPLRQAIVPALGAAASFAAYKYGKGRTKKIAQYAFIGCVFKLIDDATDAYFQTTFADMFKGKTGGVYMGPSSIKNPALAGAFMQQNPGMHSAGMVGGAHMQMSGAHKSGLYGVTI